VTRINEACCEDSLQAVKWKRARDGESTCPESWQEKAFPVSKTTVNEEKDQRIQKVLSA